MKRTKRQSKPTWTDYRSQFLKDLIKKRNVKDSFQPIACWFWINLDVAPVTWGLFQKLASTFAAWSPFYLVCNVNVQPNTKSRSPTRFVTGACIIFVTYSSQSSARLHEVDGQHLSWSQAYLKRKKNKRCSCSSAAQTIATNKQTQRQQVHCLLCFRSGLRASKSGFKPRNKVFDQAFKIRKLNWQWLIDNITYFHKHLFRSLSWV